MITRFKLFIIKLFRINTFIDEYDRYRDMYEEEAKCCDMLMDVANSYKNELEKAYEEIDRLKALCKDPLAQINKEVDEVVEQNEKCLKMYEDLLTKQEQLEHSAFARGRASAYSEMGIRNIEAHERGNELLILDDGEVVELITGLEDVKTEEKNEFLDTGSDEEIFIEDLVE